MSGLGDDRLPSQHGTAAGDEDRPPTQDTTTPEDTVSSTRPTPETPTTPDPGPTGPTGPTGSTGLTEPTGPAVGTLAWGLVVLAVAGVLVVREVTDLRVDLSYALPVGMVALGLLLVVGAVLTGARRR